MREIKFRGINNDGNWCFGDLIQSNDDHNVWIHVPKINHTYKVVPETVGQFTGLLDATGKEIYEGDILSLREGSDEMIKVIDFYAAINALDFSEMMNLRLLSYCFESGEVHVIGNVHDNLALLEEMK